MEQPLNGCSTCKALKRRRMNRHLPGGETEAQRDSDMPKDAKRGSPCQGYTAVNNPLILLLAVH